MKTNILKENLKEALSVVERVATKSATLPILQNILISTKKNSLEVAATDLEVGIRYRILAKNEEEGAVVVPSRFLSQFVGLLPEANVSMVTKTEGGLHIASKGYSTTVKTLNAEEFPIIPSLKGDEESLEVETDVFCRGITQVAGFVGQTPARPEISGVYFAVQGDTMKIVATDSFRLAEKTLYFKKTNAKEHHFILPQKAARELVAILGEKSGKTKIFFSPSQVVFDYADEGPKQLSIQLVSRLIEGEYPRYEEVIPSSYITKSIIKRAELANHIKAASIFSGKMNDVAVHILPKEQKIEFVSKNTDVGENQSFVGAKIEGEEAQASFNWRFLNDGVAQIQNDEVELGVSAEDGPVTIKPLGQEGFVYVVMPIRA